METYKAPFAIFKQYREVVKENYGGKLPLGEKLLFYCGPILSGIILAILTRGEISSNTVSNLLTVHGIFLSVLITSYAPFLDFLKPSAIVYEQVEESRVDVILKELKTETVLRKADDTVRKLLFVSNSLCVVLSLAIIVLLCLKPLFWDSIVQIYLFSESTPRTEILPYFFFWLVFSMIVANGLVLMRVVAVMTTKIYSDL